MVRVMRMIPTCLIFAGPALVMALTGCASPPAAGARPVAETTERSADAFLAQHFADDGDVSAVTTAIDLDGDGVEEIVAYAAGPMLCGSGGCNVLVLQREADGFAVRMDASVSRLPVTALDSRSHGWRDLTVGIGGGGGPGGQAVMRFDGARYPSNPTVPPATMLDAADAAGTVLIAQDAQGAMRKITAD